MAHVSEGLRTLTIRGVRSGAIGAVEKGRTTNGPGDKIGDGIADWLASGVGLAIRLGMKVLGVRKKMTTAGAGAGGPYPVFNHLFPS